MTLLDRSNANHNIEIPESGSAEISTAGKKISGPSDMVAQLQLKKELDTREDLKEIQAPYAVDSTSQIVEASTSQIRPRRSTSTVQRFGNAQAWVDVEGIFKRKNSPKQEYETEKSKKRRPSPEAESLTIHATNPTDIIQISSYDSLFDGNESLSEADADIKAPLVEDISDSADAEETVKVRIKRKVSRPNMNGTRLSLRAFGKTPVTFKNVNDTNYIVQWKWCYSTGNVPLQFCRQCIAKSTGDSCRFLGIRALPITRDGDFIEFLEPPRHLPILVDNGSPNEKAYLPTHYDLNRPMDQIARTEIMHIAALSLIDILREGLLHANIEGCVKRSRELQIRAMCDYCSTGLFVASYMCERCGQEYCIECRKAMTEVRSDDRALVQLCHCVKDKFADADVANVVKKATHSANLLRPVSRFSIEELQDAITGMECIITEAAKAQGNSTGYRIHSACDSSDKSAHKSILPVASLELETTVKTEDKEAEQDFKDLKSVVATVSQSPLSPPSHPLAKYSKISMTEDDFLKTWSKGEPLVVTDVETRVRWNPQIFIERYGEMQCEIVRSDEQPEPMTNAQVATKKKTNPHYFDRWNKVVKVGKFFSSFGKPLEERKEMFGRGVWKLKDWPPSAEFSTSFPDINEDFNYAVPMPDYTRRDGCHNISALFPKNANGPDLGPKMYNAWPGEHGLGKKGTTCLHMDVADAVNIMLYADENGEAQAAQWDIFRAEDAGGIREFLREKFPRAVDYGDPIHTQVHFLDDYALDDLYRLKGIHSWRITQRVGEAVFIPAGCAHQVCNLTDCIKVAVDFISPQNVSRCFKLTEEFRGMTVEGKKSWKEDVLQLRAQLWYAWLACRAMPCEPTMEQFEKERKRRETKALEQPAIEIVKPIRVARPKKRDDLQIKQELYVPRPTASRRGALSLPEVTVKQEVIVKQESEEPPIIRKRARLSTSKARASSMMSSDGLLNPETDKPSSSLDEQYTRSPQGDSLAQALRPLELRYGLAEGALMRGIFPSDLIGSDCTRCGKTKSADWRNGPEGLRTMCPNCGQAWSREVRAQKGNPRLIALKAMAKKESQRNAQQPSANEPALGTDNALEGSTEDVGIGKATEEEEARETSEVVVAEIVMADLDDEKDEALEDSSIVARVDASTDTTQDLEVGDLVERTSPVTMLKVDASTNTTLEMEENIYRERLAAISKIETSSSSSVDSKEVYKSTNDRSTGTPDTESQESGEHTETNKIFLDGMSMSPIDIISAEIDRLPSCSYESDKAKYRAAAARLLRLAAETMEGAEIDTPPPRDGHAFAISSLLS